MILSELILVHTQFAAKGVHLVGETCNLLRLLEEILVQLKLLVEYDDHALLERRAFFFKKRVPFVNTQ